MNAGRWEDRTMGKEQRKEMAYTGRRLSASSQNNRSRGGTGMVEVIVEVIGKGLNGEPIVVEVGRCTPEPSDYADALIIYEDDPEGYKAWCDNFHAEIADDIWGTADWGWVVKEA